MIAHLLPSVATVLKTPRPAIRPISLAFNGLSDSPRISNTISASSNRAERARALVPVQSSVCPRAVARYGVKYGFLATHHTVDWGVKRGELGGASQILVSIRSALIRRPRKSATSQPQSVRDRAWGERKRFSLTTDHWPLTTAVLGGAAASGLPCAGAAPPQRPPPKTCLIDRTP